MCVESVALDRTKGKLTQDLCLELRFSVYFVSRLSGVPQRLNGKVSGQVSVGGAEVRLDGANLHGYAVVSDGRAHVSISPVPEQAGWALRSVSPIIGLFSWLFALELQGHKNGFSITGKATHPILACGRSISIL